MSTDVDSNHERELVKAEKPWAVNALGLCLENQRCISE
jgi:hypothetical protein